MNARLFSTHFGNQIYVCRADLTNDFPSNVREFQAIPQKSDRSEQHSASRELCILQYAIGGAAMFRSFR
jgi:hypothetical protein